MESMQLVIIEDQEAHFELMKRAITKEFPAATIHHFPDAGACLERLGDLNPDIIIADYLMPGMTGIEFATEWQRRQPDVAVIFISGYSDDALRIDLGEQGLLRKPFTKEELVTAIERRLEEARSRGVPPPA